METQDGETLQAYQFFERPGGVGPPLSSCWFPAGTAVQVTKPPPRTKRQRKKKGPHTPMVLLRVPGTEFRTEAEDVDVLTTSSPPNSSGLIDLIGLGYFVMVVVAWAGARRGNGA